MDFGSATLPPAFGALASPLKSWPIRESLLQPRALRRHPRRASTPPASTVESDPKVGGLGVFNGNNMIFNDKILNRKTI